VGIEGDERSVHDPDGRWVVLLARVWEDKILSDHPEMLGQAADLLLAVAGPDHVEADPGNDLRTRYYRRGSGPTKWLLVVVSYEQEPARIISAFGTRKDPRSWSA
jgi:hypothetical protein